MTLQTSDSKKRDGDTNITVVFGTDEHGKPRAAYFQAVDQDLISKAAAAMKLQLFKPTNPSQIKLAKKLPVGRIHASGTGFVPPIRRDLYSELQSAIGTPSQDEPVSPTSATAEPPTPSPATPVQGLPEDWDDIDVGHLVIAPEDGGPKEGWWEAIVLARDGDMLTLKWRDFPKEANAVRHRTAVALMKRPVADA